MNLLDVCGLCKRYPAFYLDDVSFSVRQGRIMGLIGVNGAGKSTTLKSILNLVKPDGGSIEMLGRPFPLEEVACKQETGVVLGGIDFYQHKKLKDITGATRRFYRHWDNSAYNEYMRLFGLDASKRVNELSSGMRVKYSIALALSHKARLLILDEPTSGLDPVSRDDLLALFRQLVKSGQRSILFSTHITTDIEKCADDITYIQNGKILASAEKDVFMQSFRHLETPADTNGLTLEEMMLRTERRRYDEESFV